MNSSNLATYEIRYFILSNGKAPFVEWLKKLSPVTKAKITAKIDRLVCGNFSNCRSLGHGLYELKINFGPGYRIYYASAGKTVLLLLIGGDKNSQNQDIKKAITYLKAHKEGQS
jgi:putative addiction module killer protein